VTSFPSKSARKSPSEWASLWHAEQCCLTKVSGTSETIAGSAALSVIQGVMDTTETIARIEIIGFIHHLGSILDRSLFDRFYPSDAFFTSRGIAKKTPRRVREAERNAPTDTVAMVCFTPLYTPDLAVRLK
jgi:hypothetical protein